MKKYGLLCLLALLSIKLFAPPNCEIYKRDKICYESCQEAMKAIRYWQGSSQSQQHFNRSIELCPGFAYSHMEKAVPFLKRGKFIQWKKMIDKAVELEPQEYLGYRGWCRLQFLRDYEGAIKDIERLKELVDYDIGFCQTGDYHLNIALALCYKEIGQIDKAKEIFEQHLTAHNAYIGLYDFYHLGVIEYETGAYQKAIEHLTRQIRENDYLGETYYFLALAHKALGNEQEYRSTLKTAKAYYQAGKFRTDTYTETIDKIYFVDIIEELEAANASLKTPPK
ncbi:MAG: tetratricopeptide repeat protein [Lewinellaceae bacterium]|nr:tetratricopeptide repeat protein [Phaeodactylibacter sp.]MCB9350443.1 tetratricopeptide repeat protein [Lewinellaceae bacterium]